MLRLGFHLCSSQWAMLAQPRSRKATAIFRESSFFVTLSTTFITVTKGFFIVLSCLKMKAALIRDKDSQASIVKEETKTDVRRQAFKPP
jgi:hypothetical protein